MTKYSESWCPSTPSTLCELDMSLTTPIKETWKAFNAIHYVNITPDVEAELLPKLREVKTSINRFTMWASGVAEESVEAKVKGGHFRAEIGSLERNTAIQHYRASVHEEVLRTRTACLTHTIRFSQSKKFNSATPKVGEDILSTALQEFPVKNEHKGTLEKELLNSIVGAMGMAEGGRVKHSILAAVLVYDPVTKTIDPKLRLITFDMDPAMLPLEPVGWFWSWFFKPKQKIEMDMKFEGAEWDFSTDIWDEVYKGIQPTLIAKGKELARTPIDIRI